MKKNTKIVIGVILIMLVVIILTSILNRESVVVDEIIPAPQMQLEVIENTVYLQNFDGLTYDTLSISEEFGEILSANNTSVSSEVLNLQKFIITNDVNFDGTNDVGVLDGIGYGGVNMFYDYFIVNPETKEFEELESLPYVSNFIFTAEERKITSTYRSGESWYADEYTFVNGRYINTARTQLK